MNPTLQSPMALKPQGPSRIQAPIRSFVSLLGAVAALLCAASPLQAQLKTDVAVAIFDDGLEELSYRGFPELADAMVENTHLIIRSSKGEKIVLVAGIVDAHTGDLLYGSVSEPIVAHRGSDTLIGIGEGKLTGAWDAFEDPLFGFEDPLFGFEDPLFGFNVPLLGFEDPLFGFEDPLFGFEDPAGAIDAIWGTHGTASEPETSPVFVWGTNGVAIESPKEVLEAISGTNGNAYEDGTKLLILTSVSIDAESEMGHSAAILPFRSTVSE